MYKNGYMKIYFTLILTLTILLAKVLFEEQVGEQASRMLGSQMDMVFTIVGVILVLLLMACLCCLFMKLSDLKLQRYIVKTAKQKGLNVDLEKLSPSYRPQSPLANENCTIMVPDVGIIL